MVPRFPRLVVPGYPHHITQRGVRRQTTFFDEQDYEAYLRLATERLCKSDLQIWAYCLMPNHVHAIIVPGTTACLSGFFGPLHKEYAKRTNNKREWRGHLWQGRFYSVVMDEAHLLSAMRYVELNPVRAGLCEEPEDWLWSSARGNLGLVADPLVDRQRTCTIIGNWGEYLGQPEQTTHIDRLRRQTRTGRPDGSTAFIRNVESISGRRIQKRRAGRRPK